MRWIRAISEAPEMEASGLLEKKAKVLLVLGEIRW